MRWWQPVRDMLLTGLAIFVIVSQVYAKTPNEPLLVVALALTAPSIADHAKSLLSGTGGGVHSAPREQPPSQRSE